MIETWYGLVEPIPADELAEIADLWPGILDLEPTAALTYLQAAHSQCAAYARPLLTGVPVPAEYRLAQVLQARALVRAGIIGTESELYAGSETVTVFPMDWTVKRLLNPERRIGGLA